jgi:hypothetical protein
MADGNSNSKKQDAQCEANQPNAIPPEIPNPQEVTTSHAERVHENEDNGQRNVLLKGVSKAEKFAIAFGIAAICMNFLILWYARSDVRLDERAWVGLSRATYKTIAPDQKIEAELEFMNSGKTPALDIMFCGELNWQGTDSNRETFMASLAKKEWLDPASKGALAPNAPMLISVRSKYLGEADIIAKGIKDGSCHVYLAGRLTYRDIFGQKHETWFCHTISPMTDRLTPDGPYNGMD